MNLEIKVYHISVNVWRYITVWDMQLYAIKLPSALRHVLQNLPKCNYQSANSLRICCMIWLNRVIRQRWAAVALKPWKLDNGMQVQRNPMRSRLQGTSYKSWDPETLLRALRSTPVCISLSVSLTVLLRLAACESFKALDYEETYPAHQKILFISFFLSFHHTKYGSPLDNFAIWSPSLNFSSRFADITDFIHLILHQPVMMSSQANTKNTCWWMNGSRERQ